MIFAALSTVIAVFENIMSFWLELTSLKRWQIALLNIGLVGVLSLPCILSLNAWSDFTLLGKGIMDLEDFAVSNLLLPIGSLVYILFCTTRYGMGWDNYIDEVNCGRGAAVPRWLRPYMTYVLPVIVLILLVMSFV
jgi:NSS family neurotransmitter:Na+ symporter